MKKSSDWFFFVHPLVLFLCSFPLVKADRRPENQTKVIKLYAQCLSRKSLLVFMLSELNKMQTMDNIKQGYPF